MSVALRKFSCIGVWLLALLTTVSTMAFPGTDAIAVAGTAERPAINMTRTPTTPARNVFMPCLKPEAESLQATGGHLSKWTKVVERGALLSAKYTKSLPPKPNSGVSISFSSSLRENSFSVSFILRSQLRNW